MKAFEFYDFKYPDEMWKIIGYLEQRGKINVDYMKLEEIYEDFSCDWYCVSWAFIDDTILDEFAQYVSEYGV